MNSSSIDIPRLIRIVALLANLLAVSLVVFHFTPDIQIAEQRVADDESKLRSDETLAASIGRMQSERSRLAKQWTFDASRAPQATFLRDLSAIAERRTVSIASTTFKPVKTESLPGSSGLPALNDYPLELALHGRYRALMTAIADLSLGSQVVRVNSVSVSRDGDELLATIGLDLLQPARHYVLLTHASLANTP